MQNLGPTSVPALLHVTLRPTIVGDVGLVYLPNILGCRGIEFRI